MRAVTCELGAPPSLELIAAEFCELAKTHRVEIQRAILATVGAAVELGAEEGWTGIPEGDGQLVYLARLASLLLGGASDFEGLLAEAWRTLEAFPAELLDGEHMAGQRPLAEDRARTCLTAARRRT